jgi:hypothetical protein
MDTTKPESKTTHKVLSQTVDDSQQIDSKQWFRENHSLIPVQSI